MLLLLGPLYLLLSGQVKTGQDWRTASRAPINLPALKNLGEKAAIILFSAPAFNWRGMFSTHTWIAIKNSGKTKYTIYQVVGWNRYRNKPIIDISYGLPNREWFGAKPKIEDILSGRKAAQFLPAIEKAVQSYPYAKDYQAWPGPNSNTFIAYILQRVPKLRFTMPYNALGRDYGWLWRINQLKLGGISGYHISRRAFVGNLLGLSFGISLRPLGLIIPGVGLITSHTKFHHS